jgi:predicted GNAT superfamily acetyltransferase
MTAPAPAPSLPELLDELVELGREAWRISERERVVRAQIETLQEIEGNLGAVQS